MIVLQRWFGMAGLLIVLALPQTATAWDEQPRYAPPTFKAEWLPRDPVSASARDFVVGFYAWYAPFTEEHVGTDGTPRIQPDHYVVSDRGDWLTPELRQALQTDFDAQTKAGADGIDGLDFDPFLDSQDSDQNYQAAEVTRKDQFYRVRVFHYGKDRKEGDEMQVELAPAGDSWQIHNIYYHRRDPGPAQNFDLLDHLKRLRE